jgi:hypothetical protein
MHIKQAIKHFIRLNLFLFLSLSTLFIACGKRKPPLPPIEKVSQKVEISGFQRGNQIRLAWTLPKQNASSKNVQNISRADIYRIAEPINSSETLNEEEFYNRSNIIASLPITDADFSKKIVTYYDTLQFAGQNIRLRYAIRFVNASGSKAAFSNYLLIEPIAKIANFPNLSPVFVTQDEIKLEWQSPETNIDGSKPANIIGFNVYRASEKEETGQLINSNPLTKNEFSDKNFEFETKYRYFVRTVSLGNNAEPVESQESNIVEILPKDTFPPSSPSSLTIAATPNSISIFFVPNSERDLAGYKVFRSTDKENWQLLNEKLSETATYQDNKVESGKTYYYYVVAVDKFGNESEKSEIVSEIIP